jgi:Inner membrane component of T3SS, cytoplasmic domain/Protein of unknown function (DUF3662)
VSFLLRVETACANVVERAFAVAFPSAIEPVQIARKLVASFEAASAGRGQRRFKVRLNPADLGRFAADREYLEGRWSAMLTRLAERSHVPQAPPGVTMLSDASIPAGTTAIAVEILPEPVRLALRVRKGVPPGARLPLRGTQVVGREAGANLVLADPRISRRHLEIVESAEGVHFRDLGSSNGTLLNGERRSEGELRCGDLLELGDSELAVDADELAGA